MQFLDEIIAASKQPIVDDADELNGIMAEFAAEFPGTFPEILVPDGAGQYRVMRPHQAPQEITLSGAVFDDLFGDQCCVFSVGCKALPRQFSPEAGQWDSALLQHIHSKKEGEIFLVVGFTGIAEHKLVREVQYRELLAPLMSSVLKSYISMHSAERNASRLNAALDEVKVIKEKLLPPCDYHVDGVRYARHYLPYLAGGGDYFELFDLRIQRRLIGLRDTGYFWGGMIADVSGHGPAAAVEVAMMDAILRTYQPSFGLSTGKVIQYINRHLFTRQIRGYFITALMYAYDGNRNTLYYNSAGHPPAIIKHADPARGITVLDQGRGIPLGVVRENEWEGAQADMFPGDMLILYTDGISEARDHQGRHFNRDRILTAIHACPQQEPQAMIDTIIEAVTQHRGFAERVDDETLLVLQALEGVGPR
jgi:serine phosphatase RsbU (regulator of sigma subunit)